MKKLLISLSMALMPIVTMAQANGFDKFEKDANVQAIIVGKKTFDMMAAAELKSDDPKVAKGQELFSKIESLRVFTTDNPAAAAEMKAAVSSYAKSAKLEDLIQVKEKGKVVSIKVREGRSENIISELLIYVEGSDKKEESVIVSLTGEFDLDKLGEMIESKSVSGDKKADQKKLTELAGAFALVVQPNPTSDVFYINSNQPSEVKIYDLSGRLVKSETYTESGISVAGLKAETYIVEVTTGDKKQTQKLVVK